MSQTIVIKKSSFIPLTGSPPIKSVTIVIEGYSSFNRLLLLKGTESQGIRDYIELRLIEIGENGERFVLETRQVKTFFSRFYFNVPTADAVEIVMADGYTLKISIEDSQGP